MLRDRITFMTCSSARGHTLPLVFIHKVKNPRCFQTGQVESKTKRKLKLDKKDLPAYYNYSAKAWTTMTIFEDWFVSQVRSHLISIGQEPKAILLIDNCPTHPMVLVSDCKLIKCHFLPPNTTSKIQPQDQGIASVKKRFKTITLKKFFASYSNNPTDKNPHKTFYDDYTIKDALFNLADVWRNTTQCTLKNAWHKLGINLETPAIEDVIEVPMQTYFSKSEISSWINADDGPGWDTSEPSSKEIIDQVTNPNDEAEEEDDEAEEISHTPPTISTHACVNHLTEVINWLESHQLNNKQELLMSLYLMKSGVEESQFTDYQSQPISFSFFICLSFVYQ